MGISPVQLELDIGLEILNLGKSWLWQYDFGHIHNFFMWITLNGNHNFFMFVGVISKYESNKIINQQVLDMVLLC